MKRKSIIATILLAAAAIASARIAFGQDRHYSVGEEAGTVPVKMIVTAETVHGTPAPAIARENVAAYHGEVRLPVTAWVPLAGPAAGMDLYFLVDDSAADLGSRLSELRRFIEQLPPTTAVGIAYMRNGALDLVLAPVTDHAKAAEALRQPAATASAMANPHRSLSELANCGAKCWRPDIPRHEVVMITDGIDRFESIGYDNIFVDEAIADSQRNGIVVYSFFATGVGHTGHSPALIHWGQAYLAQVSEETGGEAYIEAAASSYQPYLTELAEHLSNQYQVTFLAKPAPQVEPIHFITRVPDVELIAAHGFFLKQMPVED